MHTMLPPNTLGAGLGTRSVTVAAPAIDPAVEVVPAQHGNAIATDAARHLVVELQRAGGQQQYSAHLAAQWTADPTVGDLAAHSADNPAADLTVDALADEVGLPRRSFGRVFTREVATSPGRHATACRQADWVRANCSIWSAAFSRPDWARIRSDSSSNRPCMASSASNWSIAAGSSGASKW